MSDGITAFELSLLSNNVTFFDTDGNTIGTLYVEKPMRFEGDAEKSSKIFFDWVIQYADEQNTDLADGRIEKI